MISFFALYVYACHHSGENSLIVNENISQSINSYLLVDKPKSFLAHLRLILFEYELRRARN